MDKSKIFLDLSKCSEEERNHVFSLLPPEPHRDAYNVFRNYKYLRFVPKSKFQEKEKWFVDRSNFDKTELTYHEFIRLFEGGDENKRELLIKFAHYIQRFKNQGLDFDCVEREVDKFLNSK